MTSIHINISDEINEIITRSAKALDRSKAFIIRKAIEAYLVELEEEVEDYTNAKNILNKMSKPHIKDGK